MQPLCSITTGVLGTAAPGTSPTMETSTLASVPLGLTMTISWLTFVPALILTQFGSAPMAMSGFLIAVPVNSTLPLMVPAPVLVPVRGTAHTATAATTTAIFLTRIDTPTGGTIPVL